MSTTTVRMKASQIYKDWHVIDAAGRPLGRVATEAATLLKGKHKPTFEPHLDDGDFVIVVNAAKITLSGNKEQQMRYYRHSGYPGGLRTRTFTEQMERSPERVLENAIWGMLPKGPLGKKMVKHLKVYRGPDHPHQSQITGSERARAARDAAFAETLAQPRKVARLRPLAGIVDVVIGAPEPKPKTAAKRRTATKPKAKAPSEEAVVEAAEAAAAAEESPAPARRRRTTKAEEPAAEAPTPTTAEAPAAEEEKPAPRRRTARATAEAPTADAEAKPKTTRSRAKKADDTGESAEEAPKPRRSRAKKTETETEES